MKLISINLIFCLVKFCTTHKNDFLINNDKCLMPKFEALSSEIKPIFDFTKYNNCSQFKPLTDVLLKKKIYSLHIDRNVLQTYYKIQSTPIIRCCFGYVLKNKGGEVGELRYSNCVLFDTVRIIKNEDVYVKCVQGNSIVYENVHSVIKTNPSLEHKMNVLKRKMTQLHRKPLSVLIILIEGMSRLNFERRMPLTRKYLLEQKFQDYIGFNKIGEFHFDALLKGTDSVHFNCSSTYKTGCATILKYFRTAGYTTAFGEYSGYRSLYNNKTTAKPPTDYYFKPYLLASAAHDSLNLRSHCVGTQNQGERMLNVIKKFAITLKGKPSFGIFVINSVDEPRFLHEMDLKMKNVFLDLINNNVFQDSLIVLSSDHGLRHSPIRETVQGYYEERMPVTFISVPNWFKTAYNQKYHLFIENSKKLISPYDLFMTFQEILVMSDSKYKTHKAQGCLNCKSIFDKIPFQRSCNDAGIPLEWCTCIGKLNTHHPDLVPKLQTEALKYLLTVLNFNRYRHKYINVIIYSMSYFQNKIYVLIVFKTESELHRALVEGKVNPIKFTKVVRYTKTHEEKKGKKL